MTIKRKALLRTVKPQAKEMKCMPNTKSNRRKKKKTAGNKETKDYRDHQRTDNE